MNETIQGIAAKHGWVLLHFKHERSIAKTYIFDKDDCRIEYHRRGYGQLTITIGRHKPAEIGDPDWKVRLVAGGHFGSDVLDVLGDEEIQGSKLFSADRDTCIDRLLANFNREKLIEVYRARLKADAEEKKLAAKRAQEALIKFDSWTSRDAMEQDARKP